MARKTKKTSRRGDGGEGPPRTGALIFLLVIALIVLAVFLFRGRLASPSSPVVRDTAHPAAPAATAREPEPASESSKAPPQTPKTVAKPPESPARPPRENAARDVEDAAPTNLTTAQRLAQVGPAARARLRPYFAKQNISYPPANISLVVLKKERILEIWAGNDPEDFRPITAYHILDISGQIGPKLHDGDRQVPEGIYHITSLNPNSRYYLSLLLDYPNDADRAHARQDGRTNLGGDVAIHGGEGSFSTLPVGPQAAEDLFTLAADVGAKNVRVIIAPADLRKTPLAPPAGAPAWTSALYQQIREAMIYIAMRGG